MPTKPMAPLGLDAPPPGSRQLLDVDAQRQLIYDRVLEGIGTKFPYKSGDMTLSLDSVELDREKRYKLTDQKRAIMSRGNLDMPVKGTWSLRDANGNVLSQSRKVVARVPYLTPRGTFIFNGNEYTVANQARLRPGVYTRRRDNGELEAHVNLLPGSGRGFRVFMEPATGVFKVKVGTSATPIYPMLKSLGATDEELVQNLGPDLHKANMKAAAKRPDIADLAQRLSGVRLDPNLTPEQNLRNSVALMKLDPEVVGRSLGEPFEQVDKNLLARVLGKLVKLQRDEVEPDDRDAMANQFFLGPEDFFGERIAKDAGGVIRKTMWKLARDRDASRIPSGLLSKHLYGVLLNTGLGAPITQISPLEVLDQRVRVTRMGEGGIPSTDSVPAESRAVQPSQLGLIDIVRGPECLFEAHEVFTMRPGETTGSWVRVDSIEVGDRCLSLPMLSSEGSTPEWKPVLAVHRYGEDETGSLIELMRHDVRMRVTDEHYLPVVDPSRGGWSMVQAQRLVDRCFWLLVEMDGVTRSVMIGAGEMRAIDMPRGTSVVGLDLGGRCVLTRYADGAPHWTGNSTKIGIDTRLADGVIKGSDRLLYRPLRTVDGKTKYVSTTDMEKSTIAFPGELAQVRAGRAKQVRALVHNRIRYVKPDEVDFEVPNGNAMFSLMANLVPGIAGIKPGRLLMSSKHLTQAMALESPEAPLVQSATSDGPAKSYEEHLGEVAGAVRARKPGVVIDVQPDEMRVRYDDGTEDSLELYNNFPLNQKSNLHNTPIVKAGDRFDEKQLLARSNFTDDKGHVAVGRNLRVAYMPFEGNYEDGIVISESAAKKLSSEQMYTYKSDERDGVKIDRAKFVSMFPQQYKRDQLEKLDKSGVVKPGAVLHHGDPIFLGTRERKPKAGLSKVARAKSWTVPAAEVWEHETPGLVTDVFNGSDGVKIAVKTYSPSRVGDKLSNRYGAKGVITRIVPDDQMPRGEDDSPMDVVLNSLGLISRVNPVQLVEASLGKVAAKTGKPYTLPAFMDRSGAADVEDYISLARRELLDNGMRDTETVFNPSLNVKVPDVFTGVTFMVKQHHLAEGKTGGRATGGYTADNTPARGGFSGAKQVGTLEYSALLGHGQVGAVVRDTKLVRGQRNDQMWKEFREGLPLRPPRTTFTYEKMLNMLTAAGVNVRSGRDGVVRLGILCDSDVDELAGAREITGGQTVSLKDGSPIQGGLFDLKTTGGLDGTRWSKITLASPLPNPLMEDSVRRMLGMTEKQFEDTIATPGGSDEIAQRLGKIDLDTEIDNATKEARTARRSARDKVVKRLKVLRALRDQGVKPSELMISKLPVLPPVFRPVSLVRGAELTSDVNLLYQDLLAVNESIGKLREELGDENVGDERLNLYKAARAVVGVGDPINVKTVEKGAQGLLRTVFGKSTAKTGLFQYKVLANTVDTVGRSVIVPDNSLDMDEVGLPEDVAWEVYKPFVVRRLTRAYGGRGAGNVELLKWVANRDQRARKALEEELKVRPVLYTRAPALHKYNVMAAWPRMVPGHALRISPIITPGFNADFDGDAMNFHVPVSDEAVKEAVERMMPSKNLFSASEFAAHWLPRQEFLQGLWRATRKPAEKAEPRRFISKAEVLKALARGELKVDDPVVIMEAKE